MQLVLDAASWFCLTVGPFFCVVGAIGTLRLPDLYTRTHAASITDTLGAGLVLFGLALQAPVALVAVKLIMVYAFMLYTGPAASHALVKAAYAQGLKAAGVPDNKSKPAQSAGTSTSPLGDAAPGGDTEGS